MERIGTKEFSPGALNQRENVRAKVRLKIKILKILFLTKIVRRKLIIKDKERYKSQKKVMRTLP